MTIAIGWTFAACAAIPASADDDVAALIAQLQDTDPDVRHNAIVELGEHEHTGPDLVTALGQALADEDPWLRIAAAEGLLRAGGEIELIERLLGDAEQTVQTGVARLLLTDGRQMEPAIRALLRMDNGDATFTDAEDTFEALSQQRARQAAFPILQALESATTPDEVDAAQRALTRLDGLCAAHVPHLLKMLSHEDATRRVCAAELLGMIGTDAAESVYALEERLHDPHPQVRVRASLTLLRFPSHRGNAILELKRVLRDRHSTWRSDVLEGLANFSEPPCELASELVKSLSVSHEFERGDAIRAMTAIGPAVVPILIAELQAPDALPTNAHWVSIAEILQRLGEGAAASVPALVQLTRNGDAEVQAAAVKSLGSVGNGNATAVARLVEMLPHPSPDVRRAAVDALSCAAGTDGGQSVTARTAIRPMLEDKDLLVRCSAAQCLMVLGEDSSPSLQVLEALLTAEQGEVVQTALDVYESLGPEAAPSTPALIAAFKSKASVSNGLSARAIHEIVPRIVARIGTGALSALITALDDADPQVRGHAAEALGLMGSDAAPAVPVLANRFRDQGKYVCSMGCMWYDRTVAETALEAVVHIGPNAKDALPALAEMISQQPPFDSMESSLRSSIVRALGAIGSDARGAIPWLWDVASSDADAWMDPDALLAIAQITPDDIRLVKVIDEYLLWVPRVDPMLTSTSTRMTEPLMDLLEESPALARPLIPTLRYLSHEAPLLAPKLRLHAAYVLAVNQPDNLEAIQFLQRWATRADRSYPPQYAPWYAVHFLRGVAEKGRMPHDSSKTATRVRN